jgi:hypothetical protein
MAREQIHPYDDGMCFEDLVFEICDSLGYSVERAPKVTSAYDMLVNGLRVQVKKRTTKKVNKWTIDLRKCKGPVAYFPGQIDVFVIFLDFYTFVVPADCICRCDGSVPSSVAIRKLIPFRDAWHLLDAPRRITERQLGFDF